MKFKIIAFMMLIILCSCAFHIEPSDNQEFHQISQLSELAGVYKNNGNPSGYLSQIIWNDIKSIIDGIDHEQIEFIEVTPKDNSLIVGAISGGCTIYKRTYILGRDFNITDGKITMHKNTFLYTRGGDDPLLGPSYEKTTLGLDVKNQGKSRDYEYGVGLLLMAVPVSVSQTRDIRYERVSDKPLGFKDCINR
jgi:hypothetical protein